MARRAGVPFTLDDLDAAGRRVPVLANLFPSGDRLMEDFHYAGGLPALMTRIAHRLRTGALTCTGQPWSHHLEHAVVHDPEVIRPLDRPVGEGEALAVLRGNLAPHGAVMKPAAAEPRTGTPGELVGSAAVAAPQTEAFHEAEPDIAVGPMPGHDRDLDDVPAEVNPARAIPESPCPIRPPGAPACCARSACWWPAATCTG